MQFSFMVSWFDVLWLATLPLAFWLGHRRGKRVGWKEYYQEDINERVIEIASHLKINE